MVAIQEKEIYEILTQTIIMGNQCRIRDEANKFSTLNRVRAT